MNVQTTIKPKNVNSIVHVRKLFAELIEVLKNDDSAALLQELLAKIPSQASATNQLADKDFVNSTVSTETATFRGTSTTDLTEEQFLTWANSLTKDKNDYVYWNTKDSDGNTLYKRYKYNGTTWTYEYTLNNSSFTSDQWAAINSGIDSNKVGEIGQGGVNIGNNRNLVIGGVASSNALSGLAIGKCASVESGYAIAIGDSARAKGSIAIGGVSNSCVNSIAIGWNTKAANNSIVIGKNIDAIGNNLIIGDEHISSKTSSNGVYIFNAVSSREYITGLILEEYAIKFVLANHLFSYNIQGVSNGTPDTLTYCGEFITVSSCGCGC